LGVIIIYEQGHKVGLNLP